MQTRPSFSTREKTLTPAFPGGSGCHYYLGNQCKQSRFMAACVEIVAPMRAGQLPRYGQGGASGVLLLLLDLLKALKSIEVEVARNHGWPGYVWLAHVNTVSFIFYSSVCVYLVSTKM